MQGLVAKVDFVNSRKLVVQIQAPFGGLNITKAMKRKTTNNADRLDTIGGQNPDGCND